MRIRITINGESRYFITDAEESLADMLRRYGYVGVKIGCSEGTCGTCSILMDGKHVLSCVILAVQASGREVVTIEGLGTVAEPHPIQVEFVKAGAVQCGFCTPGMVLATKALLDANPDPDIEEIGNALDGTLCRCTGNTKIVDAVVCSGRKISRAEEGSGGAQG